MCRCSNVRRPRIEWVEYIDWGKTAGRTYEDGRIHLVHPENWKRGRIYFSERKWIQMLYHEMGHFLLWSDPERKADLFSRRMVTGLRVPVRRRVARSRNRTGISSTRRSANRVRKRRTLADLRPATRGLDARHHARRRAVSGRVRLVRDVPRANLPPRRRRAAPGPQMGHQPAPIPTPAR